MGISSRLSWPYPDDNDKAWFDKFKSLIDAQDATGYANREDRSLIMGGGGSVSWSGTSMTWSDTIKIFSPVSGFMITLAANTAAMADGDCLYVTLTRFPGVSVAVTATVAFSIPNTDDAYIIAIRSGSDLYLRNGMRIPSGGAINTTGSGGTSLPAWADMLALKGGTEDPGTASSTFTLANGIAYLYKIRCYASSFSNVIVQVGTPISGGTHVYVGVYKSDGTQTAAMGTATQDAISTFGTGGAKTVALMNSVSVTTGDDIYIAFLVTGAPATAPTVAANVSGPVNGTRTAAQGFRSMSSGSGLTALPVSITLSSTTGQGQLAFVGIS